MRRNRHYWWPLNRTMHALIKKNIVVRVMHGRGTQISDFNVKGLEGGVLNVFK